MRTSTDELIECGFAKQIASQLVKAGAGDPARLLVITEFELMSIRGLSSKTLKAVMAYQRRVTANSN